MLLNLAQIAPSTRTLGPGNRFAIWVQGCPFNCSGCIAPDWIPFKKAMVIELKVLADIILSQDDLNGLTISGGEPMMQAGRLAVLLEAILRKRPEFNVIVFTGFKKEQLIWDEARNLLNYIDLLIDGQYVASKNDRMGLRGSNNQRFHFLSDKLLPYMEEITTRRPGLEFHLLDDGVLMVGIPAAEFNW